MILGNIIFVHVPRCSGTSIEDSLLNGNLVDDREKHWNARMVKDQVGALWDSCFKFSIVRNPLDRVASLYVTPEPPFSSYNLNAGFSMAEFLVEYKPAPWEHGFSCSDYINEDLDMVIKYEDREEGLRKVNAAISRYGLQIDGSVVRRDHPNKGHYSDYYDESTIAVVKTLFKDDFERWY
jgi:hypothetical protein